MKSDEKITREVVQAILWDARVSPGSIKVTTKDGVVHISGTVNSYLKKWAAIDTATKIADVVEVVENIVIKPGIKIPDAVIEKNIRQVLTNDVRLDSVRIAVSVKDGMVILGGSVNSHYQRVAAEESVRWVKGVVEVRNEIQTSTAHSVNDWQIKDNIEGLIEQDPSLKDENINVIVENGIVILSGSVANRDQKIQAEVVSSLTENVVFVRNNITINRADDEDKQ